MRLITRKNFLSVFCMVFTIMVLGENFLEVIHSRSVNPTQFNLFWTAVFSLVSIAVLSRSYLLDCVAPLRAGILLYLVTLTCVFGFVFLSGLRTPLHPHAFRDCVFFFSLPYLLFSFVYFRRLKRETERLDRDIRRLREQTAEKKRPLS